MMIYLAGPEVFLSDCEALFAQKKEICLRHGLHGFAPLDNALALAGLSPGEQAMAIYQANEAAMDECALAIANITPFRGVSADAGTVYEIGYMRGKGKPVFAYSNTDITYFERVNNSDWRGSTADKDINGDVIEEFGLADNLMIPCGVERSGGAVMTQNIMATAEDEDRRFRDLRAFERVVASVACQYE